jgi:ABC-type glycerol-3-phosphate transport system substrate-binding protein
MGGYGLVLSVFSKSSQSASAFILWAASKEVHRKIVLEGGSPIRLSEIRNSEILEKYPYLRFYDKLIRDSVYRARIPEWPELQDILSRELTDVMQDKKSAIEATKAVQKWIDNNDRIAKKQL